MCKHLKKNLINEVYFSWVLKDSKLQSIYFVLFFYRAKKEKWPHKVIAYNGVKTMYSFLFACSIKDHALLSLETFACSLKTPRKNEMNVSVEIVLN